MLAQQRGVSMYMRQLVRIGLLALCAVFAATSAMAGWKEDQAAMFAKIPVQPGDTIDTTNWEKVKDLLPSSIVDWVKKGDFVLKIAEFQWDYNTDEAWRQQSASNAGKYTIGKDGEVIDKTTNGNPAFVSGEPYPEIDWKNDPQAGAKLIHNIVAKGSRTGTFSTTYDVDWIGRSGFERDYVGHWMLNYYWNRPGGEISNPQGFLVNEFIKVKQPYDLAGILQLTQRYINERADQSYSYLPAIRRVKKVSGSNRSSPFLGSDFVNDDAYGFYGKPESMEWKIVDQKIVLLPLTEWAAKGPAKFTKQLDGSWKAPSNLNSPILGWELQKDGWTGAPWAPVNAVYVPRMMYVVEAKAKDKYYNYGDMTFYIDPVAGFTYKVINDRAGSYWKTMMVSYVPAAWDGKLTVCSGTFYAIIDDKSDHASFCSCFGHHDKYDMEVIYNTPDITPAMMSPTAMSAMSK